MKRESSWFQDSGKCFLLSVLINTGLLIFLLVVFRPYFETNDDMTIALFVNGAKGTHDPHLVYSSYVIGLVLAALYRISEGIPWYALLQYAVLFGAFTAILYGVMRRLKSVSAAGICTVVLYFFAYDGYIRLQYTKTAGIAAAAGIFLLLYAAEQERVSWKALFCGYLLACTGFMYRNQQFAAELALMSGIGVFLLLEPLQERNAAVFRRRLARCAGIFAGLAVFVAGLFAADRCSYRSQEWRDYLEYNELRTELLDYGFPDYEANKEAYEKLGIGRLAYRMYHGWNHMDSEKFTPEIMRELIALKQPRKFTPGLVKDFLAEVPGRLFARECFLCFLLVFFFWILWGRHTGSAVAAVLYEALLMGAVYLYLYYTNRYLYNRVDVGLWLAGILAVLWLYRQEARFVSPRAAAALLFSAVCLTQGMWRTSWRVYSADKVSKKLSLRAVVEELRADTEHLYLVKAGTVSFSGSYDPFDRVPHGIAENILSLGGWPAMTPWYCETLASYGISNPFRDVVDNDRVYLLDQDIDSTMKYIHKYYDASAEAELVSEYPDYSVYRIVSGESP